MSRFIPLKRSQMASLTNKSELFNREGNAYKYSTLNSDNSLVVYNQSGVEIVKNISELSLTNPTKGDLSMEAFKEYLEKHKDFFFTFGLVLLLDHFIFGGVFREKLRNLTESLLDKKSKLITQGE